MTDRWAYVLGGCAWAGALAPSIGASLLGFGWLAWILGLAVGGVALAMRKPWLLCLAMLLAASLLSARAEANYRPITEASAYEGSATLASDPEQFSGGLRVDISTSKGKFEGWAYGRAAAQLRDRLAGEKMTLKAKLRPFPGVSRGETTEGEAGDSKSGLASQETLEQTATKSKTATASGNSPSAWHVRRGVVGRLTVESVSSWQPETIHYRIANVFRRTLMAGTDSFTDDQRALFSGLVFGDDREQSPILADDFLAGGLTHLLAVSGQNVVFVLLLARPLMLRFGSRGRWVATLLVLVLFATITRFESSVVRATTMAGVAATATMIGRDSSSRRYLALTICCLVLVDPRIVRSLGFQLSVLASAGLLFLARPLEEKIRGPRLIAGVLAATIAAQLFVAPLIIATFDGIPVGSLWANVLAVPISGMLMMWGMTAGIAAGIFGGTLAAVIHLPTQLGIDWLQFVARMASRFWLGELKLWHVLVLGGCVAGVLLARHKSKVVLLPVGVALLILALPSLSFTAPSTMTIGRDSALWQSEGKSVLVAGEETSQRQLLEGLRRAGVNKLTLMVATGSDSKAKKQLEALRSRYGDFEAWLPSGFGTKNSVRPPQPGTVRIGGLTVSVTDTAPRIEATVGFADDSPFADDSASELADASFR